MKAYIQRLLDATDRGADCLALGILLGFLGFNLLFGAVTVVFLLHAVTPLVSFDARSTATMVASLGATYCSVLAATAAAYRIRGGNGDGGGNKAA